MTVHSAKSSVTPIDSSAPGAGDHEAGEQAAKTGSDEAGNPQLDELERRLLETADNLKDSAKALGDLASRQIQRHPLAAFGVAFVAGLTAARLLRR